MFSLRGLRAMVLGHELDPDALRAQLQASAVPVTTSDCRTCSDPCEEGHENYPNRFDIDRDSQMLGSVKPYRRQVVISTGKSDWDREVTQTNGSLAAFLLGAQNHANLPIAEPIPPPPPTPNGKAVRPVTGVFRSTDSTRISILNGSHFTMSDDIDSQETVLVFPDYTVVADVSRSREGAQALWESAVDPEVRRGGAVLEKMPFKTWVLPYSHVILLCSHKKRDNRCAIAAPKLEQAFIHSLQENGWAADTQLECQCLMGPPLEELHGTPEETEQHIEKELRSSAQEKRVLILKTSHIGGHKYAGNCIIYTPQGSSVWYGRVSPHEVESIVVNTIIDGMVLPPLLRGGLNISRPGCKTLNDW
ncbi:Altered inheritance of mitochondria protein 32 [Hypsizygus marmoreus]|uniref:Altered inheritance of mitochondria protein 32 n=1 Tax=Hypsizygus marmoreus TaxID=39966 RepID=A0A369JRP2_HYPMA|nr:Altered inheritance of mitochondria protein 32 [Hypsizygus marmoreus]